MEIRDLQEEELPQLLALYRHLHPDGWLEEGEAARDIWKTIQALPGYHILVAVEGGEVPNQREPLLALACRLLDGK